MPNKSKHIDIDRNTDYEPAEPGENAYYTKSKTKIFGKQRWQLTMVLPPNSIYVMSGPSRYDWRHGINCGDANVTLPNSSFALRRSVVFRSTEVFSDYCLKKEEEEISRQNNDPKALAEIKERINFANRFPPKDMRTNQKN